MSRKRMVAAGKIVELAGRRFVILRTNDVYERLKSGKLVRIEPAEVARLRAQILAEQDERGL